MTDKELEQRIARIEKTLKQIMPAVEDLNKDIRESISALRDGYPKLTIVSCGSIAESILKRIWIKENIKGNPTEKTLEPLIQALKNYMKRLIYDYLRDIQVARNRAAHGEIVLEEDAVEVLRKLSTVINWYFTKYESSKKDDNSEQSLPPPVESTPAKESKTRRNWLIGFAGIALVGLLLGVIIRMPIPPPPTPLATTTPQPTPLTKDSTPAPGEDFQYKLKDGSLGPKMVVIPAGTFLMGSPDSEEGRDNDEKQHQVRIERNFAIGKYEVTVGQFRKFVESTGYRTEAEKGGDCYSWTGGSKQDAAKNWRDPGFTQTDNHPVVCVSWNDAMAYIEWLKDQTGKEYRLPTEAEWEYACRAGTTTPFYFGKTISTEQANYNGNYIYNQGRTGVFRQKTVEVGQFLANAWGLHDMHGNVWEWTCSVYDENYGGGEQRCAEPGTGGLRVLRGGSWHCGPKRVRGAVRGGNDPRDGDGSRGFRLAMTFPLS